MQVLIGQTADFSGAKIKNDFFTPKFFLLYSYSKELFIDMRIFSYLNVLSVAVFYNYWIFVTDNWTTNLK